MGLERNIAGSLGPLEGALPSVQNLALSAQGIANWTAAGFTATTKVITGVSKGKQWRVKILAPNADIKLAWKTVDAGGAAPTVTVGFIGGANDGTIIPQGAVEQFTIRDNVDLYLTPSAGGVVQVTVWEVP